MITNTGKEILAKYLMGIAPAYASYIAVGCGPKPRLNISSISGLSSSGTTITTTDTNGTSGLWVGASLYSIISATSGALDPSTTVTAITDSTHFVISIAPTTPLVNATVKIEIDKAKEVLDFEMFRVPISSRGYINDGLNDKIIFTAELPTEERYEISEIGLYSAGSNPSAGSYDSKTLYAFTSSEDWQLKNGSTSTSPTSIITSIIDGSNFLLPAVTAESAVQTLSNNTGFLNATRAARYERCRYFNNVLMLKGNNSYIGSDFVVGANPKFLQLAGQSIDFTKNSTSDLIKIAFSLVSVNGESSLHPDTARVIVQFSDSTGTQYAKMNVQATHTASNFSTNRYVIASKRLDELTYSGTFSWNAVDNVKIYTSVINNYTITAKSFLSGTVTLTTSAAHNLVAGDIVKISGLGTGYDGEFTLLTASGNTMTYTSTGAGANATGLSVPMEAASSQYFLALDAIRFDNVGTINPLYGMTGYTIIQDTVNSPSLGLPAETIVKSANSNNYIEYRLIVDVT